MKSPYIKDKLVYCRLAESSDVSAIIDFYTENRSHLDQWEPLRSKEFFTEDYWIDRVESFQKEFVKDLSCRLNVFLSENDALIGMINYTNFERGGFQNCRLGYKIGEKYQGKGIMKKSLILSLNHIFNELKLHRVEANCIPHNIRSRSLLKSLGFKEHGIAENYLKINGNWEDHILTSLVNENFY